MLFNSQSFVVFFLCVFSLYWILRERRAQNVLLLIASYIFYGAWSWKFLLLMIASTIFDYACGRLISATSDRARRRRLLLASLTVNLGVLFAFKYLGFFVTEATDFLHSLGVQANPVVLQIVLPVGISFYTFQSVGYVVDVYRGKVPGERNLLNYALYVAFFPQLVAGPIERASHLLPQLKSDRTWSAAGLESGLFLMIWGLFKKIAIADNLAPYVDAVYRDPGAYSGVTVTTAIIFFAFQIYCDFSGYTDTARGAARTLGFELIRNFDHPYVATSPVDFWRRWHMSLSQWFQDYLYYPLAMHYMRSGGWGSKYKAHIIAMALIGLWHGANWTFLVFGLYWGVLIALYLYATERASGLPEQAFARRILNADGRWARAGAILTMFVLVCVGWILFRAESMGHVAEILRSTLSTEGLTTVVGSEVVSVWMLWALIAGMWAVESLARHKPAVASTLVTNQLSNVLVRSGLLVLILFFYVSTQHGPARPFIYFQF